MKLACLEKLAELNLALGCSKMFGLLLTFAMAMIAQTYLLSSVSVCQKMSTGRIFWGKEGSTW